jgi:L-threonylcarbamoyladenylate synthase
LRLPLQTRVISAFRAPDSREPSSEALDAAAAGLGGGAPVVIPTETVYGLAAPALDPEAVASIYRIKGRPPDNPLIVHVAEQEQLSSVGTTLPPLGARLAERFWPGPLTLVVATRASLPWVTAGLDSIALREPAHEFARALIRRVGPLAAPSANRSGRPSPTSVAHVLADLAGEVSLVVDGGDLEHGLESTVVDVRGNVPVLLRPGAVTLEDLRAALGGRVETATNDDVVRSPGMKYRHYSPRAELWLYMPGGDAEHGILSRLREDAERAITAGRCVGVIARTRVDAVHFKPLPAEARAFARALFGWLRELDELGVDLVLVEGIGRAGIGRAVMDRLERAATRVIGAPPAREHRGVVA